MTNFELSKGNERMSGSVMCFPYHSSRQGNSAASRWIRMHRQNKSKLHFRELGLNCRNGVQHPTINHTKQAIERGIPLFLVMSLLLDLWETNYCIYIFYSCFLLFFLFGLIRCQMYRLRWPKSYYKFQVDSEKGFLVWIFHESVTKMGSWVPAQGTNLFCSI